MPSCCAAYLRLRKARLSAPNECACNRAARGHPAAELSCSLSMSAVPGTVRQFICDLTESVGRRSHAARKPSAAAQQSLSAHLHAATAGHTTTNCPPQQLSGKAGVPFRCRALRAPPHPPPGQAAQRLRATLHVAVPQGLSALKIPARTVQGIELDTCTLGPLAVASPCLTVRPAPPPQGIEMDTSTSASLAESLQAFRASGADRDVIDVVTQMVTKPMKVHSACCPVSRSCRAPLIVHVSINVGAG